MSLEPGRRSGASEPAPPAEDPVRAFAAEAVATAGSVCWVGRRGTLDGLVDALAADLPDLHRSGVRWSGAGVLRRRGATWFGFADASRAAVVLVPERDEARTAERRDLLRAVLRHRGRGATGVRGLPPALECDLRGLQGVPAWCVAGLARLAPGALLEPGYPTLVA